MRGFNYQNRDEWQLRILFCFIFKILLVLFHAFHHPFSGNECQKSKSCENIIKCPFLKSFHYSHICNSKKYKNSCKQPEVKHYFIVELHCVFFYKDTLFLRDINLTVRFHELIEAKLLIRADSLSVHNFARCLYNDIFIRKNRTVVLFPEKLFRL